MPFKTAQQKLEWRRQYKLRYPEKHKAWNDETKAKAKAIKAALPPKPPKEKKRTKADIEADMVCLRAVIKIERKKAMEREGVFKCERCKKIIDLKHKGASRQPTCKPCQTAYSLEWNRRNPEKHKASAKRSWERKMADPVKKLIIRLRGLTSKHAKRAGVQARVKGRKLEYLGCTANELAAYLQAQFKRRMSWDNYGKKDGVKCWEIDHIKPVTAFDLMDEEQRKACFHYTNLRPMWARDNTIKGNRTWERETQPHLILM